MPPRTPLWGAAAGLMATPRPRPPWLSPLFLLHLPPEERLAHTGDSQRAGKGPVIGRPPPSAERPACSQHRTHAGLSVAPTAWDCRAARRWASLRAGR